LPTRSSGSSTNMSGTTPSNGSGRCARSAPSPTTGWCWRSPSRGCRNRRAIARGSPCAFPGYRASAGTSRPRKPTASTTCRRCWRSDRGSRLLGNRNLDLEYVDGLAGVVDVRSDGDGAFRARRLGRHLQLEQEVALLVSGRESLAAAIAEL